MAYEFPHTKPIAASPYQVTCYIIYCHFRGLAPSTIRSHISVISMAHSCHGRMELSSHNLIKKAIAGVTRLGKKTPTTDRSARKAITCSQLEKMLSAIDTIYKDSYTRILLRAMFVLAFRAGLRCGELIYVAGGKHTLTLNNVKVLVAKKSATPCVSLTFHTFKHSKQKVPLVLRLPATNSILCPVKVVLDYISVRPSGGDPLFVFASGKPVTRAFYARTLTAVCEAAGYDKASYNTHSFRIGFVTYLRKRGVNSDLIKHLGRWKSNAHEGYDRPAHIPVPP